MNGGFREEGGRGVLGEIGRLNEIRYMYDNVGGEEVYTDAFTYKYSAPVRWKLGMYKSIRGSAVIGPHQPTDMENGSIEVDLGSGKLEELAESSPGSAFFTGRMTGVRLITTGFVKRSSVTLRTKNLDTVVNGNTTAIGETDDEASDVE